MHYGDPFGKQEPLAALRLGLLWGVVLAGIALAVLTGCGFTGSVTAPQAPVALRGTVHGGQQPVSGSSVQLYAAGISGVGSTAQPLLGNPVQSDDDGSFSIPASYRCPSASSQIYVVARGGSPGLPSGDDNPALALTAMLGPCDSLSASAPIYVNEVTTIGSVWPVAAYMKSPSEIGSASNDPDFLAAVSSVNQFVDPADGSSPGTATPTSYFNQSSKLYSLAEVLAKCVDSPGGSAGDGSPCGMLFSLATPSGAGSPADTMTAAMRIAQNPDENVTGIYDQVAGPSFFQPVLTAAPPDWTLKLSHPVAAPSISLASGTYVGNQEVTISDATAGSTIYYTTDGTVPTASSPVYSGALSIAVSSTIQAIAVVGDSQSSISSSTLTITATHPPTQLAFRQQPSNALTQATISPAVQVVLEDTNGIPVSAAMNPVTLALSGGAGLGGTLTATPHNGIATFSNLTVGTAGSYTLSATSPSLTSATSTSFTISAPGSGTAPSPVKLAFLQQPSNALTQATISPAVRVVVEDTNGNTVAAATNRITLALIGGSGLGGTLTVIPQNGIATFSNLTVSTAGSYTLSATSPTLTSAASTSFTISAPGSDTPSPVKLAFLRQPSNAVTQATISPAVQVVVQDTSGNTVPAAANPVTLALIGGSGLGGTLTVIPQNGIATFSNLTVSTAGSYTLSATSTGLTSAASTSFTISQSSTGSTPISVALTPGSVTLAPSQTQAFTASVSGTSNQDVAWSLSPAVGSISAAGLYMAPTAVPSSALVTITATSVLDPTQSASATITIVPPAHAATYYVDNSCANNGNGTAPTCAASSGGAGPFNSIANAQSAVTGNQSGNSLLLKAGDTFREQYVIPAYGTSGNPFTIGAYGTGTAPIINGANLVTSWSATNTGSYYAPEPSTSALGVGSLQVFEDGTRLTQETAGVSSLAPGQWYLDTSNGQISVYTITGDNPSGHKMEVSVRQDCIENGEYADYVAVQNLTAQNAAWVGVTLNNYWQAIHYISITGVTAENNYGNGINVYGSPGSGHPISNVAISGNTTSGNGGAGIDVWTDGNTISNVSITGNIGHDDVWNPSAAPNSPNGEIHVYGPTLSGLTVEDNLAYNAGSALPDFKAYPNLRDIGSGIYIDTVPGNAVIAYNQVYNNNDDGIALEDTQGAALYGNVSYNNGVAGFTNFRLSSSNLWYNNTAYGNKIGFQVWGGMTPTAAGMVNNQFKNNIAYNNTVNALQATGGGENDGTDGYGNIYIYNDFGQQASGFIQWGSGVYYSTYSSWEAATGNCGSTGCSHSVETNPVFVNTSTNNFALASSSPTIDAGLNLGSAYEYGLDPGSTWPGNLILDNQNNYGSGWDIGAYVYTGTPPPLSR